MTKDIFRGKHKVDFHKCIEIIDEQLSKKQPIIHIWRHLTEKQLISMEYSYFAKLVKSRIAKGEERSVGKRNQEKKSHKKEKIGAPKGFNYKPLSPEEAKTIFR